MDFDPDNSHGKKTRKRLFSLDDLEISNRLISLLLSNPLKALEKAELEVIPVVSDN